MFRASRRYIIGCVFCRFNYRFISSHAFRRYIFGCAFRRCCTYIVTCVRWYYFRSSMFRASRRRLLYPARSVVSISNTAQGVFRAFHPCSLYFWRPVGPATSAVFALRSVDTCFAPRSVGTTIVSVPSVRSVGTYFAVRPVGTYTVSGD